MGWNFNWHVITGNISIDKIKLEAEINRLNNLNRSKHNLEWITFNRFCRMFGKEEPITKEIILYDIFLVGFPTPNKDDVKVMDNLDTLTITFNHVQYDSHVLALEKCDDLITAFIDRVVKPTKIHISEFNMDSRDGISSGYSYLYFGYTEEELIKIECNEAIDEIYNRLEDMMNTNEIISYVSDYLSEKVKEGAWKNN
jgi:hypothetical protein